MMSDALQGACTTAQVINVTWFESVGLRLAAMIPRSIYLELRVKFAFMSTTVCHTINRLLSGGCSPSNSCQSQEASDAGLSSPHCLARVCPADKVVLLSSDHLWFFTFGIKRSFIGVETSIRLWFSPMAPPASHLHHISTSITPCGQRSPDFHLPSSLFPTFLSCSSLFLDLPFLS